MKTTTRTEAKTWSVDDLCLFPDKPLSQRWTQSPRSSVTEIAIGSIAGDRLSWHVVDYLHGLYGDLQGALSARGLRAEFYVDGTARVITMETR
jgi:hypothetical protein